MTTQTPIINIIKNTEGLYTGTLVYYSNILLTKAGNHLNPYHNIRHMLHILWECYDGAKYHELDQRIFRNLLIAAVFHDFNHSGKIEKKDNLEIERAIEALRKFILPDDKPYLEEIISYIRATEFPHVIQNDEQHIPMCILRDADMSQTFSPAWLQQIIFGLSREMNIEPIELLEQQSSFLQNIKFSSDWGKQKFTKMIPERISEAAEYVNLFKIKN